MKSSTNHLNPLLKSHQLLEQNEDTIASIVENLQLGRLDNCLVQYSSLLSNLISLSLEFDSYPAEDEHEDFSEIVCQFPDALMRKDLLDDMRTPDMMFTPDPPVTPPCTQCALSKRTAFQCRVEAGHIAPHNKFTSAELRDFLCATEVLAQQHGEYNVEKLKSKHKTKKTYKRWNSMEKYTVMLAIARSGSKEVSKVLASVENRTENQLRSFINKNFTHSQLEDLQRGIIPPPPPKYQPPPALDSIFAAQFEGGLGDGRSDPLGATRTASKLGSTEASALAPVANGGDGSWNALLRQAASKWTGDTNVSANTKSDPEVNAKTQLVGQMPAGAAINQHSEGFNQNVDPNMQMAGYGSNMISGNNAPSSYQPPGPSDGVYNTYLPPGHPYDVMNNGSFYAPLSPHQFLSPPQASSQPQYDATYQQQQEQQHFLYQQQQQEQLRQLQEQVSLSTASTMGPPATQTAAPSSSTKRGRGGSKSASKAAAREQQRRERMEAEAALAAQQEMILRAVATGTISGESYERFLQAISSDQSGDNTAAMEFAQSLMLTQGNMSSSEGGSGVNLFSSVTGSTGQNTHNLQWSNNSIINHPGSYLNSNEVHMNSHSRSTDYLDEEGRMLYCPPVDEENSLLMFGS